MPEGGWPGARVPLSVEAYVERVRTGPCFVCRLVRGAPEQPERVLHRDRLAVPFLSRPAVLPGRTLVAPVRHVEGGPGSRGAGRAGGRDPRSARLGWTPVDDASGVGR